jgi:hypothetical protein
LTARRQGSVELGGVQDAAQDRPDTIWLGQHDRADTLFDDSIQVARRHGNAWALSLALNNRGTTC